MQCIDCINTPRPKWNGQHFAGDIIKRIFFNENVWILIKISLKFVLKGPINIIPALVQIMVWRRPGYKPLSEPTMVSLPTPICVTRPQLVKSFITRNDNHVFAINKSRLSLEPKRILFKHLLRIPTAIMQRYLDYLYHVGLWWSSSQ